MIQISIKKKGQAIKGLIVQGHADYAEAGQDIVCASVSALVGALLNGLEHFCGEAFVYELDENGYVSLSLEEDISPRQADLAHTILTTFSLGVQMIVDDYPGHVKIHTKEVDDK